MLSVNCFGVVNRVLRSDGNKLALMDLATNANGEKLVSVLSPSIALIRLEQLPVALIYPHFLHTQFRLNGGPPESLRDM